MISLKVEMKAVLVYQTNHFNYLKKVNLNSLEKKEVDVVLFSGI